MQDEDLQRLLYEDMLTREEEHLYKGHPGNTESFMSDCQNSLGDKTGLQIKPANYFEERGDHSSTDDSLHNFDKIESSLDSARTTNLVCPMSLVAAKEIKDSINNKLMQIDSAAKKSSS